MNFKNPFKKPVAKAYWWTGVPNFGDALAPLLLARFADLELVELVPIGDAKIVSIGSVLEHIPAGWSGHIVGSGMLREGAPLKFNACDVKILALRGPYSASRIPGQFALGDPGLLANELVEHQEKKWDLGIVPHWLDKELVPRFQKLIPKQFGVQVIHPSQDPLTVIRKIGSCKRIVTSSLHGMIVADSFGGIARRVEICDGMNREGGLFKFRDYSASIQCRFEVGKMIEPDRNRVDDARFQIYDAYRELSRAYGKR